MITHQKLNSEFSPEGRYQNPISEAGSFFQSYHFLGASC